MKYTRRTAAGGWKCTRLRGVDFGVEPGEMVAVMGPSGCGKTTLLNCLSGLDEFDSGEVRIEGADLRQMNDRRRTDHRSRRMGFIFQTFNLLPVLTAVENVELPLLVGGTCPGEARRRSVAVLERVGLERIHHRPAELSGGQRQRVSVARSLVNEPAIVWADEPTGNLDSKTTADVMDLIRQLNSEQQADLRDRHPRRQYRRHVQPHRVHERWRDRRPGPGTGQTGDRMNLPLGLPLNVTVALGLLIAVVAILLFLFLAGLRQPVMAKLGMRSIPRRPTQSILIVFGLTLSTVIIMSALAIGDTLNYSVQWHAIKSYGEIDEIIAPPLLATFAQFAGDGDSMLVAEESGGQAGGQHAGRARDWRAGRGQRAGQRAATARPGPAGHRLRAYEQLRDRVQQEPLADGIAASILFPTIIRNTTTGQGEPLAFVMAVDDEYTQGFGLHAVDGQAVTMARLRPGVGNIFVLAGRLFGWASETGSELGFGSLKPSDLARAIAGTGAPLSAADSGGLPGSVISATLPFLDSIGPITSTLPFSGGLSLASLNLNTLSSEIDGVLGEVGLQMREGEVYLSRLGAERLDARPGDRLEIFLGPIPLPYRVVGIVDEAGPLATLSPVVMMRLDEAQQLLFMQGRINNVLISNRGDAVSGMQHSTAMTAALARPRA